MRLYPIGNINDLAADHKPKKGLPLSVQLRLEREMLFGKALTKRKGPKPKYSTQDLHEISEQVAAICSDAFQIPVQEFFIRSGWPRFTLISICYLYCNFTMKNCSFVFSMERKNALLSSRKVKERLATDQSYANLYNSILEKLRHENIII